MRAAEFEELYQRDGDPWGYRSSGYEQAKYEATLRACGAGPFVSALELGGSIGVFSALLAPRCQALTTIDFSPTAVDAARLELAERPHVQVILGEVPAAIADGAYDLVVASEILYYLTSEALTETLLRLEEVCAPAARLVAVHWRPPGRERPLSAASVHRALHAEPWLRPLEEHSTSSYLLHVLERRERFAFAEERA